MAQNPTLNAEKRTITGKHVKKLRREGRLPANVYGKGLPSTAIQVSTKDFDTVFKSVGETGLVDLIFEGKSHPVLVKNLQLEYPLRTPLHVDFYQVNLKEKVKTMVPLEIIGEPKAVTENIGILLQQITEVEVEALPMELPEKLEVNVESLAQIGDQIIVSSLTPPQGVEVLTDPEQIIVKIDELVVEEPEEEAPAEGEEGETAEGEAAEGEGTAEEGEKSDGEEGKPEDGKGPANKENPEEKKE